MGEHCFCGGLYLLIEILLGSVETAMISLIQDIDIVYDNSKPFSDFLRKQGVKSILQKTGLTLRDVHRIVPHVSLRFLLPLWIY